MSPLLDRIALLPEIALNDRHYQPGKAPSDIGFVDKLIPIFAVCASAIDKAAGLALGDAYEVLGSP